MHLCNITSTASWGEQLKSTVCHQANLLALGAHPHKEMSSETNFKAHFTDIPHQQGNAWHFVEPPNKSFKTHFSCSPMCKR